MNVEKDRRERQELKEYLFRRALPADLPRIQELFAAGKAIMRADGNHEQWIRGYPTEALLLDDMARGEGWILESAGQAEAYFALFGPEHPEPTYAEIDGAWLNQQPYRTIHRLATTGAYKGVSAAVFNWVKSLGSDIRVDTHRANRIMQGAVLKAGFIYCGVIVIEDGSERLAYQWLTDRSRRL